VDRGGAGRGAAVIKSIDNEGEGKIAQFNKEFTGGLREKFSGKALRTIFGRERREGWKTEFLREPVKCLAWRTGKARHSQGL